MTRVENNPPAQDRRSAGNPFVPSPGARRRSGGNRCGDAKERGYLRVILFICLDLRSQKLLALFPYSVRESCSWSLFFILFRLAFSPMRLLIIISFLKMSSPEIVFLSRIFTPFRLRNLQHRECEVVDYLEEQLSHVAHRKVDGGRREEVPNHPFLHIYHLFPRPLHNII